MNIKKFLLVLCCTFLSIGVYAQDKIFKKTGEVLDVKVTAIESDVVFYKKTDNITGPEYTMQKFDIAKIKYANGSEEVFDNSGPGGSISGHDMKMKGKKSSIFSIAPIQLTENGFGFGLTMEQYIDKGGWVSLNLPLITTFNQAKVEYSDQPSMDPMVYFMPGIKVYTNLNSSQITKFSINPALVLGFGRSTDYNSIYPAPSIATYETRVLLGAMVTAGANIFPTQHLYLGADFGLGFTYLNEYNGVNRGVVALTQLAFKVGYRL